MTPIDQLPGVTPDEHDEYRGALSFAAIDLAGYASVRSFDLARVLHAVMVAVQDTPTADVIAALRALTEDRP